MTRRAPFNPDRVATPPASRHLQPPGPLTVSQVTALVKHAIQSVLPSTIHVVGEISNFKRHSSGHLYLTLKDASSELGCVMWRSAAARLKFTPTDGLEVVASGTVEVFERAGRYQLYIRKLEPRGVGALELAFRQLRDKLQHEGLFDTTNKKQLPEYPRRVVIVTSPTGAAVVDMLQTLERRYPCLHILVYPVRVQGEGAAGEIAKAIRSVDTHQAELGGVDVMIVGRGGGSLEDLWAFNEEVVARAIYACRIPLISAVGHEVDVTIADLVADVRAATPTAAAELAVPDLQDVLADLDATQNRLTRSTRAKIDLAGARMTGAIQRRSFAEPATMVHHREQIVDELAHRMQRSFGPRLHKLRRWLDATESVVQRIAPHVHLLRRAVALREVEHRMRWAVANRTFAHAQHVERLADLIPTATQHRFTLAQTRLESGRTLLQSVSHERVLARGFSITRTKKGRRIVRTVAGLKDHQRLITQLADGEFESQTVNVDQLELFE